MVGGCWITASALVLLSNGLNPVVYSISFEKFLVVGGGGGWMLDYNVSSGPF